MKRILKNMKRFILACILAFPAFLMACSADSDKLKGVYITEDYNTNMGDSICKVTYTFMGDSLFIDTYPSGCFVAAMRLEYFTRSESSIKYNCNATETIYDVNEKGDKVAYKKIYHLSFIKCGWDKNAFAVYREGEVVDIIKPFKKMPLAVLDVPINNLY